MFPFARPTGRVTGALSRLIAMDRFRSDRNMANWLRGLGSEISALDADQARFLVRGMRQDSRLAEEYFTELLVGGARKLNAPVISVVGERDSSSEFYQERYTEWAFLSDSLAVVVLAEAGHFFVRHRALELAEILTRTHRALRAPADGEPPVRGPGTDATWWLEDRATAGELNVQREPMTAAVPASDQTSHGRPPAASPAPSMRRFLVVALSQLISITGSTLTQFALPLWIYLQTGSLARFGLLAVLGLVPGIVIAPVAGAIVDRGDRRQIMIAGDVASGGTMTALLALAWVGELQLWHIYVLISCLSVAVTFQRTAYQSAIPQIVPKRYLGNANGIVQAATGFGRFIAPLLGVGLLAAVGLRGILTFDVASYAIAVGVTLLVRFPATMPFQRAESVRAEMIAGFRYILANPSFRAMVIFAAAVNLFLTPLSVLMAPLVLSFASLSGVAVIAVSAGAGALVAGLAMSIWGGPQWRRMLGSRVFTAVLAIFAVMTGLRPNLLLVGIGLFGISFCLGMMNGIFLTIVQTKLPQRLQGRMNAMLTMIATVTLPVGFGLVAAYGPRLLSPLATAHGTAGAIIHTVIGTGPHRSIGLLYVCCGIVLALIALGAGRIRRLARFDAEVPDALPDDLLGIETLRLQARSPVGERPGIAGGSGQKLDT
jgi:MFS family permease